MSGEITEINKNLDENPGLLNKKDTGSSRSDPYMYSRVDQTALDWLCKIKLSKASEVCLDILVNRKIF